MNELNGNNGRRDSPFSTHDRIEARNVSGQTVALDDPEAESFTGFQDDMTFPLALTTTKWLSTAIGIERDNRKSVTFRLRMEIGNGSRAKQSA